ncbi:MAG: hypothetical protein N2689_10505 [Verrucomicrobiae bacterium]|nr:hypothetical protein [Verrucomicrobiae bacterium]
MDRQTNSPSWIIARLGNDLNWWVDEASEEVYWPEEGLSVLDPRQFRDVLERVAEYRDVGFDLKTFARAFRLFTLDAELPDGRLRLAALRRPVEESEAKLFALPAFANEEESGYRDLVENLIELRVKLLNQTHHYAHNLETLDLEEELQNRANDRYFDGTHIHCYDELNEILQWAPAEWDGDEELPGGEAGSEEDPAR